ncbi:hypothetical protein HMPREF1008_00805 [Olsenella sp. oral taxon 809 str. F0356]|uniref:response regulator transcription factor n=1 Tax=Olsenella sp. oral taxon 809 TaxID=661086 RepID=UPI000231ECDC|nr:response regulator transcription factor [Olsenella sp. oral taxon 809]EHF02400.1 hypothetical protein HMPREF1008_00805 [Olsenella sp. oral taxon 809 str. F0356]
MAEEARHTVLVADDEDEIREVLRLYLQNAGYHVVEAADGGEALRQLREGPIDICLLDIMMPEADGYEVLRRLRAERPTPVVLISAKGQDAEKVLGLDLGADDYLVKPFNPLEAVARVNSLMRRVYNMDARPLPSSGGMVGAATPLPVSPRLVVRDLELDVDACRLTRAGKAVELTLVEYRIMELMMSHPGRVFTKQQIYEAGWEESYLAADNNVMVCISKLRGKLSDDPGAYISTVRGLGYRLEG